jgi:hypothetical protein
MKRLVVTAAIAVLAALPAAYGLIGNASFGESVPVRIPARATLIDDRNGFDDNAGPQSTAGSPTSASSPATSTSPESSGPPTTSAPSAEDNSGPGGPEPDNSGPGGQGHGGEAEPGDDHGGQGAGDVATTAVDDHGGLTSDEATTPGEPPCPARTTTAPVRARVRVRARARVAPAREATTMDPATAEAMEGMTVPIIHEHD